MVAVVSGTKSERCRVREQLGTGSGRSVSAEVPMHLFGSSFSVTKQF